MDLTDKQQQQQNGQLRPPKIKEHPISMVVKKHDPTQLECKADGNPKPIIEWYKDNVKIEQSSSHPIIMADGETLFFLHVNTRKGEHSDTGIYYCLARNEVGKARSNNATLDVAN
ncbi:Roundabout 1 [Dermatophagoides pteronyssinus]|uniref:Roundabout 1 n=1 Tax=Dermatophagoides pteronyssinus TaxID=6956 RepID=A0ABQ8JXF1_DERPT|nr:Roundabout 1 [Dermatophagoides pteronyssinus]